MKISKRLWYWIVILAFPVFFVLHGVNEQFGLLRVVTVAKLFALYTLIAVLAALVSLWLMKTYERATVFTFFLLCIYFFFGAVKDGITDTFLHDVAGSYKVLLSLVALTAVLSAFVVRKVKSQLSRASRFIGVLLLTCVSLEAVLFVYNVISGKERQKDFGDINHEIINNVSIPDSVQKPTIVWIVMDEYSGNSGIKKKWNFDNPVNTMLREKGFFVADSAVSPYNYTHYSLVSTLDMVYLRGLQNHSVIGYRDIVRGNVSLRNTNVVKLLEDAGYDIYNYTIYNIDNHPTRANEHFIDADFKLIDNQTLSGRIRQDIWWNFKNIFSTGRRAADSADKARGILAEARFRETLISENAAVAKKAASGSRPSFLMFHYMLTHEPFIYKPDGTLDLSAGFGMYPERYVPSIERANEALSGLIDSIQMAFKDKNLVIIIQGDHGYKFDEGDPLFEQEGCSILYAVYCSDLQYPGWEQTFNAVNGFRVLFNKYFHTNLPVLENHVFNLYYR